MEHHKAVVVSRRPHVRRLIEAISYAEPCDVVYVESAAHAYSLIKQVVPERIVVCMEMSDTDSLHVLSMLLLDSHTRKIPVVIHMTAREAEESANESCKYDHDCGVALIHHTNPMN